MGVREICEREIVFQRQICKPPQQLVSSFHSDETKPTRPTESCICRLASALAVEFVEFTTNSLHYLAFFPFPDGSKRFLLD